MPDIERSHNDRFIDTHEGIVLVVEDNHTRAATDTEKELRAENARLRAHFVQIAAEFNRASSLGNPEACLTQVRRIVGDALNGR